MKKIKFLALTMSALLSVNFVWGADPTLTEGFETATAVLDYTGTAYVTKENSDCGIGWTISFGNVTTTGAITGDQAVLIRHAKNTENCGYLQSTTGIKGLKKIDFNLSVTNTNMKFQVYYSTDAGANWTALTNTDVALSNKDVAVPFSYSIPSSSIDKSYTIKIAVTAYPAAKHDINIDDIVFTYTATPSCTAPTITSDLSETEVVYTKNATATALSITATGTDVTYQWYSNTSKSTSGATTLTDQTSASYTPPTNATGTTYYYCVASSSTCTTTSKIAKITVTPPTCYVTFLNNSQPVVATGLDEQGRKQYHEGDQLGELPTLDGGEACDKTSNHFMGWTSDAGFQKRAEAPSFVNGSTTVNGDMTLRAVWAKEQ